jgi:hypothetical protein
LSITLETEHKALQTQIGDLDPAKQIMDAQSSLEHEVARLSTELGARDAQRLNQ